MTFRPRLSAKAREELWRKEAGKAKAAGIGEYPVCNLCGGFVLPGRLWDISHDPGRHAAWGGTDIAVAHRKCNRLHAARVAVPAIAKAKRQWRNNVGINEPGLGPSPLPGGRNDRLKKKLDGSVVLR